MRKVDFSLLLVVVLFAAPLTFSIFLSLSGIFSRDAWLALFDHPQLWPALQLSIFTGLSSSAIAIATALLIVAGLYESRWWKGLAQTSGAMQALPHAALAIGLAFLIMPSGLIARVLAVFTDWQAPPQWVTTHDPYGLAMIIALSLKEIPFLIWIASSILNRDDMQRLFAGQRAVARSLGHDVGSIWLRIFLPQLFPKLVWPMVIVFIYAATVVDVALIIGPTQPPTLANVIWADINSELVVNNERGAAGAVFLTGVAVFVAAVAWGITNFVLLRRDWLSSGPAGSVRSFASISLVKSIALIIFYVAIGLALVILSLAVFWPFPLLLPQTLNASAWVSVWQDPQAVFTSMLLAFSTVVFALLVNIAWLENQSPRRDGVMIALSMLTLGLPTLLLGLGEYRAALRFGLTGGVLGLFIVHLLPVTAYMFIALVGPYRAFDPRWKSSAYGLLSTYRRFFWMIKLPMLKAPLLAAGAIGFAVSFGQYVPAQLISAGRFSTLPMEAVTLTSGSNRPLTAAFSLVLMLPPLLVFLLSGYLAKSRWVRT